MKILYLSFFTIIWFFVASCSENKTQTKEELFTIKGDLVELKDSLIYMVEYVNREPLVLDSTLVSKNKFEFKGKVDFPKVVILTNHKKEFRIPLFIENSEIIVNGKISSLDSVRVSGSSYHNKLTHFNNLLVKYDEKLKSIADKYYLARDNNLKDSMEIYESEYSQHDSIRLSFIQNEINNSNNNVFGLYLTARYVLPTGTLQELEDLTINLPDSLKSSKYYSSIHNRITILSNTEIGKIAPGFTQNSINGEHISLYDYKGKYLLIDFWASWCKPCRQENPNVVEVYRKFNHLNFEVLGVSLDNDKEKWKKAIEDDNLTWTHVSDLNGWKNEVAQLYGVNSIPFSILLDTNGVIINKNLRGEDLHTALDKLLKSSN